MWYFLKLYLVIQICWPGVINSKAAWTVAAPGKTFDISITGMILIINLITFCKNQSIAPVPISCPKLIMIWSVTNGWRMKPPGHNIMVTWHYGQLYGELLKQVAYFTWQSHEMFYHLRTSDYFTPPKPFLFWWVANCVTWGLARLETVDHRWKGGWQAWTWKTWTWRKTSVDQKANLDLGPGP